MEIPDEIIDLQSDGNISHEVLLFLVANETTGRDSYIQDHGLFFASGNYVDDSGRIHETRTSADGRETYLKTIACNDPDCNRREHSAWTFVPDRKFSAAASADHMSSNRGAMMANRSHGIVPAMGLTRITALDETQPSTYPMRDYSELSSLALAAPASDLNYGTDSFVERYTFNWSVNNLVGQEINTKKVPSELLSANNIRNVQNMPIS